MDKKILFIGFIGLILFIVSCKPIIELGSSSTRLPDASNILYYSAFDETTTNQDAGTAITVCSTAACINSTNTSNNAYLTTSGGDASDDAYVGVNWTLPTGGINSVQIVMEGQTEDTITLRMARWNWSNSVWVQTNTSTCSANADCSFNYTFTGSTLQQSLNGQKLRTVFYSSDGAANTLKFDYAGLVVNYNSTNVSVGLNLSNNSLLTTATPTLNWTGISPDGNSIEYQLQVDNVSSFNSSYSNYSATDSGFSPNHPYASGVMVNFTFQSPLNENQQYYWRVRGTINGGSNYGDWSPINNFSIQITKGLDDGTNFTPLTPNSFYLSKEDMKLNKTCSVPYIIKDNFTQKKSWGYSGSGNCNVTANVNLTIKGDYIVTDHCIFNDFEKVCKAIYIEQAYKNQVVEIQPNDKNLTMMNVTIQVPTRTITQIDDHTVQFAWEGVLDPTYTAFSSSTMCNPPNTCVNTTTYHNNLTNNVTDQFNIRLSLPFDVGTNRRNNTPSEDLYGSNDATLYGSSVSVNSSGTHYSTGKGLLIVTQNTDYVVVLNNSVLNPLSVNNSFAMSLWVYSNCSGANWVRILDKFETTGNGYQLIDYCAAGNTIALTTKKAGTEFGRYTSSAVFTKNVWHHIVTNYDNRTIIEIWVDGVNQSLTSDTGYTFNTANANLYFGMTNAKNSGWRGRIDEFVFYRKFLNSTEISTIYTQGVRATKGYFQFNQSGDSFNIYNSSMTVSNNLSTINITMNGDGVTPHQPNKANNPLSASSTNGNWNISFISSNASDTFYINDWNLDLWLNTSPSTPVTTDFNRFYKFNELSGTNIQDYGTDDDNATLVAGTWLGNGGKVDTSLKVTSPTYPVAAANGLMIGKDTVFSTAFWINGTTNPSADSLIMHFQNVALHRWVQVTTGGVIRTGMYESTGAESRTYTASTDVINSAWHWIMINATGDDLSIWVDNVEETVTPAGTAFSAFEGDAPSGNVQIGSDQGGQSFYLDVWVTRVGAYFNQSEITALYNGSIGAEFTPTPPPAPPAGNQTPTPTNFSCTGVGLESISCSWQGTADKFLFYRDSSNIENTTGFNYTDAGLSQATTYSHYVKGYSLNYTNNLSNASSTLSNTTLCSLCGENLSITDTFDYFTGWRQVLNNPYNEWLYTYSGNISDNDQSTSIAAPAASYVPIALVGNLDSNLSDKEIMVGGDTTTIKIYKLPFVTLNKTITTINNSKNYALYDVDNDSIEEIIVVKATQAEIYKHNSSNDNFYLWKNRTIDSTVSFNYMMPICRNGYCYWNNQRNGVYKYDTLNNTVTTFNIGSAGTNNDVNWYIRNPLISDNCTTQDNSTQVIFFSDYDADTYLNDIAIIPLNNFQASSAQIYNMSYPFSIVNALVCEKINNSKYIGLTTGGVAGDELWDDGVFKINSSNLIQVVAYQGAPDYADHMNVPIFIDVNGDTESDYCIAYDFFGVLGSQTNYTTKFWCIDVETNTTIFKTNFNPAGYGNSVMQLDRAGVYGTLHYGKFLGTDENVFLYGNHILNATNGKFIQDWGLQKLDTRNLIPVSYGSSCTNLYYTSKTNYLGRAGDTSITLYGDTSNSTTCSYMLSPVVVTGEETAVPTLKMLDEV